MQLRPSEKVPYGGTTGHARLGAVVDASFVPVGRNVGIVLDGMFIAVDIDHPSDPVAQSWMAQMDTLATWQQATPRAKATPEDRAANPRGHHWLVAVPPGWTGNTQHIFGEHGQHVGDVIVNGYIVAPGSAITCADGIEREYVLLNPRFPAPAPPWLLTYAAQPHRQAGAAAPAGERDQIPSGEHDDFLASLGAFLRTRHGMGESGLQKALAAASVLLRDVDPRRPYTDADYARIARSCANLGAQVIDSGPLMPSAWRSGAQVALVQPPVDWWERGFFPKGRLVALYGAKGKGKSTLGGWTATRVTQAGGTFAPILVEETEQDFLWRAVLAGADRDKIFFPSQAGSIQIPRDANALQQALEMSKVDVVWFDSVYSHFGATPGMNAAERARACLTPLAEICKRTGITIVIVFHEKKEADIYLGSVEMVNVARVVLRATRSGSGPMYLDVTESNLRKPDYKLAFGVEYRQAIDPLTNDVQMERMPDGSLAPYEVGVPVMKGHEALIPDVPEELVIDDQEERPVRGRRQRTDGFVR